MPTATQTATPTQGHATALFRSIVIAVLVGGACTSAPSAGTPAGTSGGPGASSSSPTPGASAPSSPATGPVQELRAEAVGRALTAGTYRIAAPFGVPTTITVPAGWTLDNLDQGEIFLAKGGDFLAIHIVESVFADPCESRDGPIDPPIAGPVDAVVAALAAMKHFQAGPVSNVSLGVHPGKAFELTNSFNSQVDDCYGVALLPVWTYRGGVEVWTIGGSVEKMLVIDVEGTTLVIDRGGAEVDAVAESIRFGSPTAWTPTPPTPAPTGPRLSYVALGDSILFADEGDCGGGDCTSAAVLYGEKLGAALGLPVDVHNLTMHNSLTSEGLLTYLQRGARFGRVGEDLWDTIAGADVVSVTIGFNDANNRVATQIPKITAAFEANLEGILDKIEELRAGKRTAIRVTNLYNNGGPTWTPLVEAVNAATCKVAERHGAICVDIYEAFNGADGTGDPITLHYLGPDGVHPSQAGMDAIADVLAAAGYDPLRK